MLGVSFNPTNEAAQLGPQRGAAEGVQQALKVLSLRLPQNASSPIAPMNLMMQGARPAQDILAQILRMFSQGQGGAPGYAPSVLTPTITPNQRAPWMGGMSFSMPQASTAPMVDDAPMPEQRFDLPVLE